jgi:hypothetical protein
MPRFCRKSVLGGCNLTASRTLYLFRIALREIPRGRLMNRKNTIADRTGWRRKGLRWTGLCAVLFGGLALEAAFGAARQEQQAPRPFSTGQGAQEGITNEPPPIPVEEIVQKFGAHEAEFKRERDNFTYEQTVVVQTVDNDGSVDGEYRLVEEIVFTPQGRRYEHVTDAPVSTLQRVQLSPQDESDLEHVQPFVLTTEDLPKYDIHYVGREQVDEIATYVFDVGPKKIEKNQRYFQGRIWVDQRDLAVVKTYGKAVPDIHTKYSENVFPRFETIRENIEGTYWFPTYTHADDVLHFSNQNVRIRMTVRYRNYKRFGVTVKFGTATEKKPQP